MGDLCHYDVCLHAPISGSDIDDDIVKPNENSHAYCEALRKAGVPVEEMPHETGGHHWGQWQDFPASMFEWIASLHAE